MNTFKLPRRVKLAAGIALGCAGFLFVGTMSASAGGPQCAPRTIALSIKTAVLAMKATQYCLGYDLPYTASEVSERLESLECGEESIQLIDDLLNNYEQEYKTILAREAKQVVCMQATTISLETQPANLKFAK